MVGEKQEVHDFWNRASCGEDLYLQGSSREAYAVQAEERYRLEPYIPEFAGFETAEGQRVLEIGIGLGSDHQRFAECGADLWGIDLTERAVEHTRHRLAVFGLSSNVAVGDAEKLGFPANHFDLVYSWGVLHHSPSTERAVAEVWRVLKLGRTAKVMIYHKCSLVGLMLWVRYALLRLRPWRTLADVYASHLESPGTKAYTVAEAQRLFSAFRDVSIRIVLTHGDLLQSMAGQQHEGYLLWMARRIWPRRLITRLFPGLGLFMLIEARK